MSNIEPYSWSEFPTECLWYLMLMGPLHLALFVVCCLASSALAVWQRGTFRRRVGQLGLFLGLLLAVGSVANGFWSCLVWGRLYFSTDYVSDFSPFWPITQKVIDAPFGDMRGQLFEVSLPQLQVVWLLFAVITWTLTILLYQWIRRRPPANQIAPANRRPALQPDGSDNLSATVAADRAFPAAVAELGRSACHHHRP
jgi:hypothetical protein